MEIQEGICPVCGKPTKLIKKGLYRKYCSYACRNYILNKTILKDKEKENLNKNRNFLIQFKKDNCLNKFKKLYTTGHILKYDTDFLCHCDICDKDFNITRANLYNRIIINKINPCPICHKKKRACGRSKIEYELFDFLKTFNLDIKDHYKFFKNRKLEFDFYIPEMNIAFEFDGTYWHCDPRFYAPDYIMKVKNITAKEIWEKDAEKDKLSAQNNVILYRVKEYDWKNDKDRIKQEIKNLIGIKDV